MAGVLSATVSVNYAGVATDIARARREVETHQLALARATRQANDSDQLWEFSERLQTAERGLATYQRRAGLAAGGSRAAAAGLAGWLRGAGGVLGAGRAGGMVQATDQRLAPPVVDG